MKRLKSKYIRHLTPGLIFKDDYGNQLIYCVVNNNKVLYAYSGGNGTVTSDNQNYDWNENWFKLVLADKELLDKYKVMKYLKPKYIQHLTPGLIFKSDNNNTYTFCVVNNKKVLYTHLGGNGTVYSVGQNHGWSENYYKLVLAEKELLDKFKL